MAFLFVLIAVAFDWILACAIVKFITLCFSLTFSWAAATGIWLIMLLLKSVFKNNNK